MNSGSPERSEHSDVGTLKVMIIVPTYNEAETLPLLVEKVTQQNIEGLGFIAGSFVYHGVPDAFEPGAFVEGDQPDSV